MNDAILWLFSGHHAAAIAGALSLGCFLMAGHLVNRGGAVLKRI
jgi:hypothetical protein